jgi:diguanylate cyclase (GGDEF)-like protein/PAS domain S-box-containing protein
MSSCLPRISPASDGPAVRDADAGVRPRAQDVMRSAREAALLTLDSIGDGVVSTDRDGRVVYLNRAAERMTQWSCQEACGRLLGEVLVLVDGGTRQPAPDPVEAALQRSATVGLPGDCMLLRRDGTECAIEDSVAAIIGQDGLVTGVVMVFRDVTEARSRALKLSHRAEHDFLTGLPNRLLLDDRLDQAIARARRQRIKIAVLYVDVDHFKEINDSLGHVVGDALLQQVGARLVGAVRGSDTVSRHGGDEFVVVLCEVSRTRDAARHAEKIRNALALPYALADRTLQVTVSIGISLFPDDGQDAQTLVQRADKAMYEVKQDGRNGYRFFARDMAARTVGRGLRSA